jgi:hypothetical protein
MCADSDISGWAGTTNKFYAMTLLMDTSRGFTFVFLPFLLIFSVLVTMYHAPIGREVMLFRFHIYDLCLRSLFDTDLVGRGTNKTYGTKLLALACKLWLQLNFDRCV